MTDTTAPHSPIDELSERFLAARAELSPAAATIMGMQGYDDKLPDRSPGGFDALIDLHRTTVAEAKTVEVSSFREETAKDALLERIELDLERYEAGVPQYELNGISCVPVELRAVFDLMPTSTDEDWENLGRRLDQVGTTLDGYRETLLQQADAGRVSSARQVKVLAQRSAEWSGAEGNDYFVGLTAKAPESAVKARVEAAAIAASKAFSEFGQWLTTDLLPHAPNRDAVGREVYQLASRDHIGATLDLEEATAPGPAHLIPAGASVLPAKSPHPAPDHCP
ncbi:DUF885 family protein [Kribbella catacumbae]|uniref:DUF885 family protein n=1 Tax=Kribbella catacumbae TaxID=460086 RepID=UPI0003703FBE|nr:DUF885 family protein [Kribbella catacumbae]